MVTAEHIIDLIDILKVTWHAHHWNIRISTSWKIINRYFSLVLRPAATFYTPKLPLTGFMKLTCEIIHCLGYCSFQVETSRYKQDAKARGDWFKHTVARGWNFPKTKWKCSHLTGHVPLPFNGASPCCNENSCNCTAAWVQTRRHSRIALQNKHSVHASSSSSVNLRLLQGQSDFVWRTAE